MKNKVLAILLFILCFLLGTFLSRHKILWNDECYTQAYTIDPHTYGDILRMDIYEGNTSPLFYLLQKSVTDLFQYHFPMQWTGQTGPIVEERSQMVLRITPNFFMSLGIAAIFYFFASRYSLLWGGYALAMSLSSFMVWAYWLEARPYSLWFCLTSLQVLVFLHLLGAKTSKTMPGPWVFLGAIHVLLALTAFSSMAQITIITALLWLALPSSRTYIWRLGLPVLVCLFYAVLMPKGILKFAFASSPLGLVLDNFSADRLAIAGIFIAFCLMRRKFPPQAPYHILLPACFLCAAGALIAYIAFSQTKGPVFFMDSRYFIYLAPVEIIATVVFSRELMVMVKPGWGRFNMGLMLGGLLLVHGLWTYKHVFSFALYSNF